MNKNEFAAGTRAAVRVRCAAGDLRAAGGRVHPRRDARAVGSAAPPLVELPEAFR